MYTKSRRWVAFFTRDGECALVYTHVLVSIQ